MYWWVLSMVDILSNCRQKFCFTSQVHKLEILLSSVIHWFNERLTKIQKEKLKKALSSTEIVAAALFVFKLAVRVVGVSHQTILPANFIMPRFPISLPFVWALADLFSPAGVMLVFSVKPGVTALTTAAAAAADSNAQDNDSAQGSKSDHKGLKIQPADSPTRISQFANRCWRKQPSHWVVSAVVCGKTPKTLGMGNTSVTCWVRRALNWGWRSCGSPSSSSCFFRSSTFAFAEANYEQNNYQYHRWKMWLCWSGSHT